MGWEVYPEGLYHLLKRLGREVPWPLYVTENGAAYPDLWTGEAVVEDPERVAYLEAHVEAALRAKGVRAGDLVRIGGLEFEYIPEV